MNKLDAYNNHASILSLDIHKDKERVYQKFPRTTKHWQMWVQTGSENLILPAITLVLNRHDLMDFLPDDLQEYLLYVLELNRERNRQIIQQAEEIRDILNFQEIIIMKGTGNLVDQIYNDVGERMIYDIDILVPQNKMASTARKLKDCGYHTQKHFNDKSVESTMHYPILLREDKVAGVEIHQHPVQYLYQKAFPSSFVSNSRLKNRGSGRFWVMGYKQRIIHNFLHSQLMHSGHYHGWISLRDLYDLLLLNQHENVVDTLTTWGYYKKEALGYASIMHRIFDLEWVYENQYNSNRFLFFRHRQVHKMNSFQLKWYFILFMVFQKYLVLPMRMVWNAKARNYVFSRLLNAKWYKQHVKAVGRLFCRSTKTPKT